LRLQRYSIPLYVTFVALMAAQSIWWVIYLGREGEHYSSLQLQRFKTDQVHALLMISSVPEVAADPQGQLGDDYPHLVFRRGPDGPEVEISEEATAAVIAEGRRRQRMFFWEGAFFIVLLLGGGTLVTLAYLREQQFRRARELFLAGVTHEFKTPLASLLLYAETLGRSELKPEDRGGILQRMAEDIQRLRSMVEQVLAVSRAEGFSGQTREVLDLAEESERVLEELAPIIVQEGATLEKSLSPGCLVLGDRQAFGIALRNLVDNAIHYGGPRARVGLRLDSSGRWHRLAVSDQGPGIPRKEQRKIFKSFYRVGEAGRRPRGTHGTGLGLFLVKRNMEAMGGQVELLSREGEGATFILKLPARSART
jgi:signal transduction histidine kinase